MRKAVTVVLLTLLLAVAGLALAVRFGIAPVGNPRVLLDFVLGRGIQTPDDATIVGRLKAADGYSVSLYAGDLPLARWLRFTSTGDLIVSRTRGDEVVLLERDRDGDGRPDGRRVLLAGLDRPHGLELHDGWLYVAERTAVGRIRFDEQTGRTSGRYEHFITGITGDGNHFTRTIRIGPDGRLYLSQGSTCNVCEEKDERRATIMTFAPDGSDGRIFARGLRNSVGFDWAPWDGALYATENARDLLGDDFPPDELNRVEAGAFYGWPYVNGFNVLDPDLGPGHEAMLEQSRPPVHGFRAHNAPLGITFLRAPNRPPGYERAAVVALHGSWNRSRPDGYKVVSLHWLDDGRIEERDFLAGFLAPGETIGRPADVAEGPDGAIYVSDDYAGAIYRVAPVGPGPVIPFAPNAEH
ncbi:MAG: sorbosone dehydrogenase family protein [Gammaproteobacteria bacterium]|nr:sorbosone dehydrogenase family protein [Gammaproteobacteria bacterium]